MIARIVVLALVLHATTARAQDAGAASVAEPSPPGARPDSLALRTLRLEHRVERRREGWSLAVLGALGIVGGSVMAIAGRDDPFYVAHGLTALSFGAINLPLGIALMDVRGSLLERISADEGDPEALRLDAIRGQRTKRLSFAVNTFLDVLYIASGALMIGLADRTRSQRSAEGAGWALVSQGAFLLAFDVAGWVGSSRRIRQLDAL
ncbi:MAG: hypothetical protein AAGH15_04520 [Myxococcota bacterium]